MVSSSSLPVELWLEIFRCATLDPWTPALYDYEYHPFDAPPPSATTDDARHTKCALTRVCKQWRRWAIPLLYEDILIPRTYNAMKRMLCDGEDWEQDGITIPPCARLVRRALLPYSSTVKASAQSPLGALDVLQLCSRLQVLVRSADHLTPIAYDFATPECPPLPALKRLDWWHHNEAARTGGINSLAHVLAAAPALECLSVGGELWPSYLHEPAPPVALPRLATLRFRRVNAFFVLNLCRVVRGSAPRADDGASPTSSTVAAPGASDALPALRHVVFDHVGAAEMFWPLWAAAGAHVRTVELGPSLRFYVQDFLACVLAGAPGLAELNYYVNFTHPPLAGAGTGAGLECPMAALRVVGLHAHPNQFYAVASAEYWAHLGKHFAALAGPAFPALREVRLYGDWSAAAAHDEFVRIVKPLREKGCVVEVP